MGRVHTPEHGYAYLSHPDGGVRSLGGVAEVEEHPSRPEVCVTFEDGELGFYRTDFVEVE